MGVYVHTDRISSDVYYSQWNNCHKESNVLLMVYIRGMTVVFPEGKPHNYGIFRPTLFLNRNLIGKLKSEMPFFLISQDFLIFKNLNCQ